MYCLYHYQFVTTSKHFAYSSLLIILGRERIIVSAIFIRSLVHNLPHNITYYLGKIKK